MTTLPPYVWSSKSDEELEESAASTYERADGAIFVVYSRFTPKIGSSMGKAEPGIIQFNFTEFICNEEEEVNE